MTDKNIQESEVADKSSEKRAQISLKMIQLRMKQNKERATLASQKKSLQKEETMNESFSASQIAALKAEYSKINGIDPDSDIYKKLIAMLDRLDLKSLQSLAGAEVKFVSKLAQNRVARKSMKKEEVESIDELSTNKLADYKKKAGADASAADKAGDMRRGNKRFSGIMKATRKQFSNDSKKEVTEMDNTDSHSGPEREVNPVTNKKRIVYKRHEKKDVKTEELSPKQKEIDKNKNGKIDGFDLAHLRKKNEELSPKQKELDKNKNGKIDGTDLAHLRSKKKLPQGADFAAQRRKERMASTGRMDEEVKVGDKVSFNHPMKAIPGKTMKKVGTVHKVEDDTVHVKVKDKYGVITHKKSASELTREEFDLGEESINEKSDYEVYHKDYSGAVQTAIKQAEKRGYEVDMDDWHDKVATGPKKPSSGKTNSFSVNLMKDGKPSKKKLQMQVYNMDDHKYELNMYIEEIQLDELNKDTLHSYAKKSEKDQDDQFNKIGKGIRDNDPKSANKAGHKFSMRSIGQNRAEKQLAKEAVVDEAGPGLWANIHAKRERIKNGSNERMKKPGEKGAPEAGALNRARGKNEAASPAQQAAIAIAMKKDGKEPKDRLPKKPADEYDRKVVKYLKKKHGMSEGIVDKIKAIKRGMQAKAKADDHFDKAGDPKNANASKDLKKAVRYNNLLNKEETEIVTEAKKKSFKDVKKKMKEEETPNKSTVKKGDALTGKREPIEINPEIKESKKR